MAFATEEIRSRRKRAEGPGMPTLAADIVCDQRTRRRGLGYLFTKKHHIADQFASQWLPELSLVGEFDIFDAADLHNISKVDGGLYGVARDNDGLQTIGTDYQQIAYFPVAQENRHWHGFPLYPLSDEASPGRTGEHRKPPKEIFDKLVIAGLITEKEKRRLKKGGNA